MRPGNRPSGDNSRLNFPKLNLPRELVKEAPTRGFDVEEIDTIVPDKDMEQADIPAEEKYRKTDQSNIRNEINRDSAVQGPSGQEKASHLPARQQQTYGNREMPSELPAEHPFSQESLLRRQMAGSKNATSNGAQAVRKTADAGKKYAQNALDNIKKKLTNQAIKASAKAAWGSVVALAGAIGLPVWATVGFIIAILAGIIALAIGISVAWTQLHQSPSSTGQTMNVPTSPIVDQGWLSKLLLLSGDLQPGKTELANAKTAITTAVTNLQNELRTDKYSYFSRRNEMISSLSAINAAASQLDQAKDVTAANDAITNVKSKIDAFWFSFFSANPDTKYTDGQSQLPSKINPIGYAPSFHMNTFWNPTDPSKLKNITGHRTYLRTNGNVGEAADINFPDGTPLYAMFDGNFTSEHATYVLTSNNGKYRVVYGHVSNPRLGKVSVADKEPIARVGAKHLHIEVYVNGQPLLLQPAQYSACSAYPDRQQYGGNHLVCRNGNMSKMYWEYIKTIFGS